MKFADAFVIFVITAALTAATVYIYLHASDTNFAAWCGLVATVGGIYHWLTVYDDKRPDDK
jgi:hypothetical protein